MSNTQELAIIYCRVSTTKQAQQNESIEIQEKLCRSIAEKKGIKVVKVWRDSSSGRKEDRPVLEEIFEYIKKFGQPIRYLIFRDIDRLTRGGSNKYNVIKTHFTKLGVELVDSYGLIQARVNTLSHLGFEYDWSVYTPSEMAETMKAGACGDEVRNILTRMIGTEVELVQKGYHIGDSNDGYINQKVFMEGGKKNIMVPDPMRKDFYLTMFNMRASGEFTDEEIVTKVNAMGFRSRIVKRWNLSHTEQVGEKGGVPLDVKQLQRIIQRPIYCGVIVRRWSNYKPVKAKFEGLVSVNVFNQANRGKVFVSVKEDGGLGILYDYHPEKIRDHKNKYASVFPYKKIVMCPLCKKPFTGSFSIGKSGGKFPYYHCSRGHKYLGVPVAKIESKVQDILSGMVFTKELKARALAYLRSEWINKQKNNSQSFSKVETNIKTLEDERDQAIATCIRVSNPSIIKGIEERVEEIENQIRKATAELEATKLNVRSFEEFSKFAETFFEHPAKLVNSTVNIKKKQALFSLVFSRPPTYDEISFGTPEFSPIVEVLRKSQTSDSQVVTWLGFEPRTASLKGNCSTS